MPHKLQKGFTNILTIVFMVALFAGIITFSEAGKLTQQRKISALTACTTNPQSKDCKSSLPVNLTIAKIPQCSNQNYEVVFKWDNKTSPLILELSQNPNFEPLLSKDVSDKNETKRPTSISQNIALTPEKTYYWRLWYGIENKWITGPSFSVASCTTD